MISLSAVNCKCSNGACVDLLNSKCSSIVSIVPLEYLIIYSYLTDDMHDHMHMSVCMHAHTHVWAHTSPCTHTRTSAHAQTHTHTNTLLIQDLQVNTASSVHLYAKTFCNTALARSLLHASVCVCEWVRMCVCARKHVPACVHAPTGQTASWHC